ncbi:MAG: hypothetical protein EKK64_08285 [Neisseriaceae bacterium]|nr:MAG: hypothetical protein EKK64_08285 [Neisseriaceae bacterium]
MKIQRFANFNRNESKTSTIETPGPIIKVEDENIDTTWIVTLLKDGKSIDAIGNRWELCVDDASSLNKLKNVGLIFEEPHTYIYDTIRKSSKDLENLPDIVKLIKGVNMKEFIKIANYNHAASTFE